MIFAIKEVFFFRILIAIFFLCLFSHTPIAQRTNQFILKGVVIDSINQEALPFASIYFAQLERGIVTNPKGEFEFVIDQQTSTKKLTARVSYLGYLTKTVEFEMAPSQQSELFISLIPSIKDLGEVVVSGKGKPLNARKVVDAMLQRFSGNFNQEAYILNGYYRQTSRDLASRDYDSYIEADVGIMHSKSMQLPKLLSVNQVRAREDYRTSNMDSLFIDKVSLFLDVLASYKTGLQGKKLWKDVAMTAFSSSNNKRQNADSLLTEYQRQFNPLKSALMESRIYDFDIIEELYDPGSLYLMTSRYASNLHDRFLERNVFRIDSTFYSDRDRVYRVKFLPKKKSSYKHIMPRWSNFVPVGYLYINAKDYSIIKYSMQFVAVSKDVVGSRWTYKVDLDFVKREGLSYPFYLQISKKEPITAAAQNAISTHLTEKELLITRIVTDPQAIKSLQQKWTWNPDLYDPSHKFDSLFWSNHRFIKETSDQQQLRKALELRISSGND